CSPSAEANRLPRDLARLDDRGWTVAGSSASALCGISLAGAVIAWASWCSSTARSMPGSKTAVRRGTRLGFVDDATSWLMQGAYFTSSRDLERRVVYRAISPRLSDDDSYSPKNYNRKIKTAIGRRPGAPLSQITVFSGIGAATRLLCLNRRE